MIIILLLALISFSFAQDTLIRWEEEVNLSQDTVYNFYPWIECQDNYVHVVWYAEGHVFYRRSTDSGITWDSLYELSDTIASVIHPKLDIWGDAIHCIWVSNSTGGSNWHILYRRSLDSGESWGDLVDIGFSKGVSGLEVVKDTILVILYDTLANGLYLKKSVDGGISWLPPTFIIQTASGYDPQILYNDGITHLVWMTETFNPGGIFYLMSTNLGNSWSDTVRLSAINSIAPQEPVMAKNEQGIIFVGWPDNKYSPSWLDDILLRISSDNGISWGPEIMVTDHHLVGWDEDHVATHEDLYFVWRKVQSGNDALQFRASTDMGETWWPIEDICNNPILTPTITADTTNVHIAWSDNRVAPLEIYYRRGTRLPVGIEEKKQSVTSALLTNISVIPNPFREKTEIRFRIQDTRYRIQNFSLKIYDITGKVVVVLGHQNIRESGYQGDQVVWNGRDKNELQVPAGIYFCEVKDGTKSYFEKIVKLK